MSKTTISKNDLKSFSWNKLSLSESVKLHTVPHFTRKAIGEWLEYEHPQKAIDKILERNPYIKNHSVPVNMTATDSKNYDTQVFHPVGFLLIVMESNQQKAIKMKEEVANFVYDLGFLDNPYLNLKPMERATFSKLLNSTLKNLEECKTAMRQEVLIEDLRFICSASDIPMPDLNKLKTPVDQIAMAL